MRILVDLTEVKARFLKTKIQVRGLLSYLEMVFLWLHHLIS